MAVLTGNPLAGIITYFGLAPSSAPTGAVDDISDFLDGVESSEDTDELDATTFRRTTKNIIAGFSTNNLSLSGKWSSDAHAFFSPLRKMTNVNYEYGPAGKGSGDVKISGHVQRPELLGAGGVASMASRRSRSNCGSIRRPTARSRAATGATAGTPGTFTPAGRGIPANFAGLTGITAVAGAPRGPPASMWCSDDGTQAHWNAHRVGRRQAAVKEDDLMAVPLSPICVTLRGRDRPIRYSILALEEFDRVAGYTFGEAFVKPVHAIKMRDVATALQIGMKYGGSDGNLTPDRVLKMIDAEVEARGMQAFKDVIDKIGEAYARATGFKDEPGKEADDDAEGPTSASGAGAPPSSSSPTNSSD